jgi:hypothetical protein
MFYKKQKEIDRLMAENVDLRRQLTDEYVLVGTISGELKAFKESADALNQENADLVYRLELYESVLRQLRVPVSLPARKKQ